MTQYKRLHILPKPWITHLNPLENPRIKYKSLDKTLKSIIWWGVISTSIINCCFSSNKKIWKTQFAVNRVTYLSNYGQPRCEVSVLFHFHLSANSPLPSFRFSIGKILEMIVQILSSIPNFYSLSHNFSRSKCVG